MKVKVLNNGQLHAICEDLTTAMCLVRTLERNIDRSYSHSPFTIEMDTPPGVESPPVVQPALV